jgi:hypothetical protein
MKITNNTKPSFSPVTLSIIFESKHELDAFGTLFNICAVTDSMPEGMAVSIYEEMARCGGDITETSKLFFKILKHPSAKASLARF